MLINNIAYLLRRLPVFGVAPGGYGLQPIHIEDLARLAVEQGGSRAIVTMDAVGPEAIGFGDLVRMVRRAVRARALIAPVPRSFLLLTSRLLGRIVGDVVLTADEVAGLTANLLVSKAPPTAPTRFTDWLEHHAEELGRTWANELARHFR